MSHLAVRSLISDTLQSLNLGIQFTYARTTDFNTMRDKQYPFVQLDPLTSTPVRMNYTFNTSWDIGMIFYQLDQKDGNQDESAVILDQMSDIVDAFIRKLNRISNATDIDAKIIIQSENVEISGFSVTPFIKVTADILTGFILRFKLETPDDFNYCTIY